jgi:glycogen phosphorylase
MKFSLNGALTIGTMDGANVEIRKEVVPENFFLFGHTAEEVQNLKVQGYAPHYHYHTNGHLKEVIDLIGSGFFSHGDRELFRPLVESLLFSDEYLVLADYQSYIERQHEVGMLFKDTTRWIRMSILNTARVGNFSADRSIREYCQNIWRVQPSPVDLEDITLAQINFKV